YRRDREAAPETIPVAPATTTVPVPVTRPPAPAAPDDSTLRLEVEVLDNAWVVLDADGERVVNDEMKAGDKRTFEASEAFRFRSIGNAAGLRLTLNGTVIPPLGEDGEVVTNRVFDRDSLRELRGETASAPQTQS
ncbi:MAG TPA: DUF4115 domain-containing protein, partial [Thermoanaerobaculia bacterium]|nr:DUF4115 domain-containing protein [Thermoanaerobaculia bacterium]